MVNTGADLAFGFSDMFRVGNGLGQAMFCDNLPDYRRFELVAEDVVRGGGLFLAMAGPFAWRPGVNGGMVDDFPASTPVGRSGNPMKVAPPDGPPANSPGVVGGRPYSGHAFDQMQGRGIPPSVVENTIQTGRSFPGNRPGTTGYFDSGNNVTVITGSTSGRVVTVRQGRP